MAGAACVRTQYIFADSFLFFDYNLGIDEKGWFVYVHFSLSHEHEHVERVAKMHVLVSTRRARVLSGEYTQLSQVYN